MVWRTSGRREQRREHHVEAVDPGHGRAAQLFTRGELCCELMRRGVCLAPLQLLLLLVSDLLPPPPLLLLLLVPLLPLPLAHDRQKRRRLTGRPHVLTRHGHRLHGSNCRRRPLRLSPPRVSPLSSLPRSPLTVPLCVSPLDVPPPPLHTGLSLVHPEHDEAEDEEDDTGADGGARDGRHARPAGPFRFTITGITRLPRGEAFSNDGMCIGTGGRVCQQSQQDGRKM